MSAGVCEGLEVAVIDDEPIVIKSLQRALGKMGCAVEVFQDAREAFARVDEKAFDIVVTDVIMGEIDGVQILERVLRRSAHTKVIIMSAFAMMEMARRAMDKGAFDFIAKPFELEDMRAIVTKAARALRGEAEPA